ncbi:unnamed protein product [Owenia fusiformis]|uniref:Uncharacterized protein n=1 Tax=Owenia fusiformis TaxID=6347 RepID=A0A8J1T697_OWEFU|nr:unnamed protein product [Owenia fusiformis]
MAADNLSAIEDTSTMIMEILANITTTAPNTTERSEELMNTVWFRTVFIACYCVIFLLGVTGNSLVVFVVVRNKSMQSITNIFITNLAVSDIMMCLLSVPFTPLSAFLPSWVFGDAMCHVIPMILGVSVYVSTLTSTAIAIDRYFVIVHPFKPRMKVSVCLLLILAIWIISITISLPLAIYQKVKWNEDEYAFFCVEHWPKKASRQFFTVTSLILQYIVPCSVITFCYTKVSLVLRRRSKTKIGSSSKTKDRDELELKRKRRTNKMLIAMVAIFVCCWLPLNIVHIFAEYEETLKDWPYYTLLFFISHIVAMSSAIYNPFLYAWMNENFKKEFKTVLPCLFNTFSSQYNGSASQYTTVDTQNSVINRSPPKERNGNSICNLENSVVYEPDTERVSLKLGSVNSENV